jgi:H+-transporting ATPase
MIVMLALLNDGAILSIAYDNVHYKDQPESWNMRMVLGVATALGLIGVVSAFGLFYLGERVFHLDRPHIQTLMYLKLSVAGHLTIFLTRTRGAFWSIRPAKILWMAVLGTQTVATLIAVYGLFMTPLGWGWAGFVWGYALLWFLLNDRVKLLAYRIFDPVKGEAKAKAAKAESKPAAAEESEPEAKGQPDSEASAKPDAKVEPKPATEVEPKPDARPEGIPEPRPEVKTEAAPKGGAPVAPAVKSVPPVASKAEPGPDGKSDTKPTDRVEPKPDGQEATKPEPDAKPAVDLSPQLADKVHKFYEQLGREDVRAVEKADDAKQRTPEGHLPK